MPIDYSKFDGIGDDDEEEDRNGGRRGDGGADFERLLQQCLQQAGDGDGEAPDLFAAAGLGGGARGWPGPGAAGGALAPAPPPLPPPPPPCGSPWPGDSGLGSLEQLGAGLDGLDGGLGASRPLDDEGFRAEAWELLCSRLVVLPGPAAATARALLLEAEVHVLAGRYRQALVAALATQLAAAEAGEVAPRWGAAGRSSGSAAAAAADAAERPFGDMTAPTLALEMLCSYQLGDRTRAVALRDRLKTSDRSLLSKHLARRYEGTCEVLELVPQFLSLLRAAEQDPDGQGAGADFGTGYGPQDWL